MSCAEFQAQLPELIGSGADAAAHPHIQSCELCRALLADLETIAEAARQLFPVVEPPDELVGADRVGDQERRRRGPTRQRRQQFRSDLSKSREPACWPDTLHVGPFQPRQASVEASLAAALTFQAV